MESARGTVQLGATGLALAVSLVASAAWASDDWGESEAREGFELLPPPEVDLEALAEQHSARRWHLGIEAVTDIPISVGGQLTLQMPHGARISTSIGFLPRGYLDGVSSVIVAAGGYDESTAALVSGALENALVVRAHVGWRPPRARGFYIELGYGMVAIDSSLSASALVTAATGASLPDEAPQDLEVGIDSTLHMIDVEVGFELVFVEHLVMRFALGAALTVGADAEVTSDQAVESLPMIDEHLRQASAMMSDIYTDYVFVPTFSVALGYRLF